jgi:hypothetical protein
VAFIFWALLILTSMFGHGVPFAISWVVFLQYQFMNGSLNVPLHTIYAVLLAAGVVVTANRSKPLETGAAGRSGRARLSPQPVAGFGRLGRG